MHGKQTPVPYDNLLVGAFSVIVKLRTFLGSSSVSVQVPGRSSSICWLATYLSDDLTLYSGNSQKGTTDNKSTYTTFSARALLSPFWRLAFEGSAHNCLNVVLIGSCHFQHLIMLHAVFYKKIPFPIYKLL